MNRKTYMTVTATLFIVVAIMHLLRIILGWQAEIGGLSIPFWVSWLGPGIPGRAGVEVIDEHQFAARTAYDLNSIGTGTGR